MKVDSHEFGLCSKIELTIQVFIRWAEIKEWMVEWFHSRTSFFREIAIVKNLVLNKMNVLNWRTILWNEKHQKLNTDVSSATPSSSWGCVSRAVSLISNRMMTCILSCLSLSKYSSVCYKNTDFCLLSLCEHVVSRFYVTTWNTGLLTYISLTSDLQSQNNNNIYLYCIRGKSKHIITGCVHLMVLSHKKLKAKAKL